MRFWKAVREMHIYVKAKPSINGSAPSGAKSCDGRSRNCTGDSKRRAVNARRCAREYEVSNCSVHTLMIFRMNSMKG